MGIMAQESGGGTERELIPMDLHRAVCVNVIDLGSHMDEKWGKVKRLVRLTFELADVRDDFEVDGETRNLPRLIGKQYTLSLHERSALRQHLQAWRKKQFTPEELRGFDIATLVGIPCMINVEHFTGSDGRVHAGIGSIVGLAKGMAAPQPEGEAYYYSIDDHGDKFPEAMPEFIKEKIMASYEMTGKGVPSTQSPRAKEQAQGYAPPVTPQQAEAQARAARPSSPAVAPPAQGDFPVAPGGAFQGTQTDGGYAPGDDLPF